MTLWNEWRSEERRDALIVYCVSRVLLAVGVAGVLWLPLPPHAGAATERSWAVAAMSALTLVVLLGRPWTVRIAAAEMRRWGAPHWPLLVAALLVAIVALTGGVDSPVALLVVLLAFCWDVRGDLATTHVRMWLFGASGTGCYLLATVVALRAPATPVTVEWMCERGLVLGLLTGALTRWRLDLLTSGARTRALRSTAATWRTQALALERTRGELLAHVSHELMTPLAAIRSCAGLLSDLPVPSEMVPQGQRSGEGAFHRMVGMILRNTARLELSVQDLLELARLEEGQPALTCAWHACADMLTRAVEALEPLLMSKGQQVRVSVTSADLGVWGDARRIERVVMNLLANAHKYAGEGATIVLRGGCDTDGTRLEVADDGPGISEQALAHVFDRYYRAPGVPGQGSGLGLAIVQAEVEAHGGRVWAESSAEHGCRFVCVFPYPSMANQTAARIIGVSK